MPLVRVRATGQIQDFEMSPQVRALLESGRGELVKRERREAAAMQTPEFAAEIRTPEFKRGPTTREVSNADR